VGSVQKIMLTTALRTHYVMHMSGPA